MLPMVKVRKVLSGIVLTGLLLSFVPFGFVQAEQTSTGAEATQTASNEAASIKDMDDVSEFAKTAIISLADNNIISGDSQNFFHPRKTVKRSELIKMIVNSLNIDMSNLPETPTFTDVPKGHWAYPYVEAGYRAGIIKGISADVFGVDQECTRQEMAVMYVRALGLKDSDLEGKQPYLYLGRMSDSSTVSSWAKENVEFALSIGLLKGTSSTAFGPKQPAERQQAAVVTDRFMSGKESMDQFAGKFKNEVDFPELYSALVKNDKEYKGNVDMKLGLNVAEKNGNNLMNLSMNMKGLTDIDTDKGVTNMDMDYAISMNLAGTVVSQALKIIKLGDKFYIKYPDENSWNVQTQKEMEELGMIPLDSSGNSQQLISYYRYAQINKEMNVDYKGTKVTKYTLTMNKEAEEAIVAGMDEGQMPGLDGNDQEEMKNLTSSNVVYLNDKNEIVYQKIQYSGSVWDEDAQSDVTIGMILEASFDNLGIAEIKAPVNVE